MQNSRGSYATGFSLKESHTTTVYFTHHCIVLHFFGYVFQIIQLIQPYSFFLAFHEKVLFHSKRFEAGRQQNLKPLLLHLTVAAVLKTLG